MPPKSEIGYRPDQAATAKARSMVMGAIEQRAESDPLIQGWWLLLPLIAVIVGLVGLAAFLVILGGLGGLIFGYVIMLTLGFAFLAIMNYKMTNRLVLHTRRENLLRSGLMEYLGALWADAGRAESALPGMPAKVKLDQDTAIAERLPNPTYATMAALPFVGIFIGYYYLYHLSRASVSHVRSWDAFAKHASAAMPRSDLPAPSPTATSLAGHPFLPNLLLSLLLFPFLAYWYHLLITEMNEHLKTQWVIEDQILKALE